MTIATPTSGSTLSKRGEICKEAGSMRDLLTAILGNPYNEESNPDGCINLGTAENYMMLQHVADFANENVLSTFKPLFLLRQDAR